MSPINTVTITGTLAEEPLVRYWVDGVARTTIRLRHFRILEQHTDRTKTFDHFTVHCAGALAEHVGICFEEGMAVHVTGHLEQRSWVNEEGGQFSTVEIVATEVSPSLQEAVAEIHPAPHDR
jgi:single-stranded DNA-binding protein